MEQDLQPKVPQPSSSLTRVRHVDVSRRFVCSESGRLLRKTSSVLGFYANLLLLMPVGWKGVLCAYPEKSTVLHSRDVFETCTNDRASNPPSPASGEHALTSKASAVAGTVCSFGSVTSGGMSRGGGTLFLSWTREASSAAVSADFTTTVAL